MSADGGQTWSSVPLQVPDPPSNEVAWGLFYDLDIASTPDHTVALVTARFQLPYEDVFPELDDAGRPGLSIMSTASGVDLIDVSAEDEAGEPVRWSARSPWEQLGVAGPAQLAQDLESLAPELVALERILVGTDRLVLLGRTEQGEPGSPERSVTLTAVPRRT